MKKTWTPKPKDIKADWKLLDAKDKRLGRLAVQAAKLLMGKDKACFSPHVLCGDFVIILNADRIQLSGKKWTQKKYYSHTRFIGSLKEKKAKDLPKAELIKKAVGGMLPKNKLRPQALKRLKIFEGADHIYKDKKPELV